MAAVSSFFAHHRNEDGISPYPTLDSISQTLIVFPYIVSTIDRVVDRFGNVKDNASPELAEIRRSLSAMTGTINAAMRRVISRATKEGYIETKYIQMDDLDNNQIALIIIRIISILLLIVIVITYIVIKKKRK
jgi:dsDNA-specific endonuclease/ATPase MutS2